MSASSALALHRRRRSAESMSTKLPVVGGAVVRALERAGWTKHSQVGSHIKMTRGGAYVSVPLHDPVKRGTLASILRSVEMTADELRQLL